jgi:hypothetical protein
LASSAFIFQRVSGRYRLKNYGFEKCRTPFVCAVLAITI